MMSPPGSLGSEPNQTAKCAIWGSPVRGSRAGADASVALFGPCASGRRKGGGEGRTGNVRPGGFIHGCFDVETEQHK